MDLTILLFLLLLLFFLVVFVVVFGRKSDAGLTSMQKVVRFAFRIARWAYAVACGLDRGYLAYRRTLCNTQIDPLTSRMRIVANGMELALERCDCPRGVWYQQPDRERKHRELR